MALNLELKAHDPDPAGTLRRALALGADDHGVLEQRDTYFAVGTGRLKLREQRGTAPHLIGYVRSGTADARRSVYEIAVVEDAAACVAALSATCGVLQVVEKTRRLLLWRTVRIHLDDVADQGAFVELEAVGADAGEFEHVRAGLRIADEHLVDASYGPPAA